MIDKSLAAAKILDDPFSLALTLYFTSAAAQMLGDAPTHGALVQPVINNLMTFLEIRQSAEPWVIGLILLSGTIADELIRRFRRS